MAQFINGKEVKEVTYFEKCGRSFCTIRYTDETYENMASGDFGRNVKRVAPKGATIRFDTTKSDAYMQCEQVALNGLEAKSKQSGLGRWK